MVEERDGTRTNTQTPEQIEMLRILVQKAKTGDSDAFGEIYKLTYKEVRRRIFNKVRSRETAEDLTQDVYERALRALPSYEDKGISFFHWLAVVAKNKLVDYDRAMRVSSPLDAHATGIADTSFETNPEQRAERAESMREVRDAMGQMPTMYSLAVVLFLYYDWSHREIAERLRITEQSSRLKVFRGKRMLQKKIGKEIL